MDFLAYAALMRLIGTIPARESRYLATLALMPEMNMARREES
jgi:hypothetical protein